MEAPSRQPLWTSVGQPTTALWVFAVLREPSRGLTSPRRTCIHPSQRCAPRDGCVLSSPRIPHRRSPVRSGGTGPAAESGCLARTAARPLTPIRSSRELWILVPGRPTERSSCAPKRRPPSSSRRRRTSDHQSPRGSFMYVSPVVGSDQRASLVIVSAGPCSCSPAPGNLRSPAAARSLHCRG